MSSNRGNVLLHLSAFRQAIGLMAIFMLITGLAWGATYWLVDREINRLLNGRLVALATMVHVAIMEQTALPKENYSQLIAYIGKDGTVHGEIPEDLILNQMGDGFHDIQRNGDEGPDFRYLIRSTYHGKIIVGEDIERQQEQREILAMGAQIALISSFICTLIAGLWIAQRSQARIDIIGKALRDVAEGNLRTRIKLQGRKDDLSILADRINSAIAQLSEAMEQMRVQSSNIAHDLRTPLARLRAVLETGHIKLVEHKEAIQPEMLEEALEQVDRIVGTFDALLRIARIENGARKASFQLLELGNIAENIVEIFGPVVEEADCNLVLQLNTPATIRGDKDLILQLAANLIQNALRYGPKGQTITLKIRERCLSIADQGPGIIAEERQKVLQPLHQLSGERQNEGFGLGLSMVRAISELHNATLELTDNSLNGTGLLVNVNFPAIEEKQSAQHI